VTKSYNGAVMKAHIAGRILRSERIPAPAALTVTPAAGASLWGLISLATSSVLLTNTAAHMRGLVNQR